VTKINRHYFLKSKALINPAPHQIVTGDSQKKARQTLAETTIREPMSYSSGLRERDHSGAESGGLLRDPSWEVHISECDPQQK